jgi:hypothetical protein
VALREMASQSTDSAATRDLAAFIVLTLEAVADTVERSVAPWEKRGYWLKADRFRLDWDWPARLATELSAALVADEWGEIARICAQIAGKLSGEKVPQRHRVGTPWVGAWDKFQQIERAKPLGD